MHSPCYLREIVPDIEELLHYRFQDKKLLQQACTHCSWCNEQRGMGLISNERLEFLGDAILDLLISEWLFREHPDLPEGELSRMRAHLVEAPACASYARALKIEEALMLGKGEQRNIGRGRESVLADFFEAILGAIYLDGGLEAAKELLFVRCAGPLQERRQEPEANHKARLQDLIQKRSNELPVYTVVSEGGPPHARRFVVAVQWRGQVLAQGEGSSKREAQQVAAKHALEQFHEQQ